MDVFIVQIKGLFIAFDIDIYIGHVRLSGWKDPVLDWHRSYFKQFFTWTLV